MLISVQRPTTQVWKHLLGQRSSKSISKKIASEVGNGNTTTVEFGEKDLWSTMSKAWLHDE